MTQIEIVGVAVVAASLAACGGSPSTPATSPADDAPFGYAASLKVSSYDNSGSTFTGDGKLTLTRDYYMFDEANRVTSATYKATAPFQVSITYSGCQTVTRTISVDVFMSLRHIIGFSTGTYLLAAVPTEITTAAVQCDNATVDVPIVFAFQITCDGGVNPSVDVYYALDPTEPYSDIKSPSGRKTLTCTLPDGSYSTTSDLLWTLTAS